jgi:hypothetical protein
MKHKLQILNDLDALYGEKIYDEPELDKEIWSALANVDWFHKDHGTEYMSFRVAAKFVAGFTDPTEYGYVKYLSGTPAVVSRRIRKDLSKKGWKLIQAGDVRISGQRKNGTKR